MVLDSDFWRECVVLTGEDSMVMDAYGRMNGEKNDEKRGK